MNNLPEYTIELKETHDHGQSHWQTKTFNVLHKGKIIGQYERNYPSHGLSTFAPFKVKGKDYALYSSHYTCTRIMSLPECKDIGGEDPKSNGFCPVDLWVPKERFYLMKTQVPNATKYLIFSFFDCGGVDTWHKNIISFEKNSDFIFLMEKNINFAFVAGCVWGDDSSWKLQAFDLKKVQNGVLTRSSPFGYLELPKKYKNLSEHIELNRDVDFETRQTDLEKIKEEAISTILTHEQLDIEVDTFKYISIP